VVECPADDSAVLSEIERALVQTAIEDLDGAFTIGRLYEMHKGDISKYALTQLGKSWEQRGWLTEPRHRSDPRHVTDDLRQLAGIPHTPDASRT
jgi:hypothetical protein